MNFQSNLESLEARLLMAAPVGAAIMGDANLDGLVNLADVSIVQANWGSAGQTRTWSQGDFNNDGAVDMADANLLLTSLQTDSTPAINPLQDSVRQWAISGLEYNQSYLDRFADVWRNTSDGNSLAWNESYIMDSYAALYEGTGETWYLQRLSEDIEYVLANRADKLGITDDIRGMEIKAWASTNFTSGKSYCWAVHAGLISAPIARWVYLVRKDPVLSVLWSHKADEYEQAVKETLSSFDSEYVLNEAGDEGYYNRNYNPNELPANSNTAMGKAYLNMYLATGEQSYRAKAQQIAKRFRKQITINNDEATWSYSKTSTGPEDIGHASISIDFAYQAYRAGIIFTESDMKAIAKAALNSSVSDANGKVIGWSKNLGGTGETLTRMPNEWASVARMAQFDSGLANAFKDTFSLHNGYRICLLGPMLLGTTDVAHDQALAKNQPQPAMPSAPAMPPMPSLPEIVIQDEPAELARTFNRNIRLTYVDGSGNAVTVRLVGAGSGTLYLPASGEGDGRIVLSGTNSKSSLLLSSNEAGRVGDISVEGSIKLVRATNTELVGDLSITGKVATLTLADASGGNTITLGSTSRAGVKISLGTVSDLNLEISGNIASLRASQWLDTDGIADMIEAGLLRQLYVYGDFGADLSSRTLGSTTISGLVSGQWDITGNSGKIIAGSTSTSFQGNVTGQMKSFTVRSDFSGSLTARTMGKVTVGGTMKEAVLTVTRAFASRSNSMASLRAGAIEDSSIFASGSIGSIRAEGISMSKVKGHADNTVVDVLAQARAVA